MNTIQELAAPRVIKRRTNTLPPTDTPRIISNTHAYINSRRLRYVRMQRGITLSEFAQRAGITRQQASLFETKNPRIRVSTLKKLTEALRVKPETITRIPEELQ